MRGAFHDAATGSDGSLEKFQGAAPNRGLEGRVATRFVGNNRGSLSKADTIQLAKVMAVKEAGGPDLPFVPGRRDNPNPDPSTLGRIPDQNESFDASLRLFRQYALSNKEAVAFCIQFFF